MAGLGETRTATDLRESRHSRRTHQIPMPNSAGYGGITSGDFYAAGEKDRQEQNKRLSKTKKQNGVKRGRCLLFSSGLLCTDEGGTRTMETRSKLK